MTRRHGRLAAAAVALSALLALIPSPAPAQPPPPSGPPQPAQPFAPDWAMLPGWDVFAAKGCGKCHSIRGFGSLTGPDLGRVASGKSFFDLGAAMWNHLPRMGARMREVGIERATFTPAEISNLIAFLFTGQYFDELGDPKKGERLFTTKSCVQCHSIGGTGGTVGPPLDSMKRANSPVLVAAAMWNHGPRMMEAMKAKGVARPTFQGTELLDLIAYIVSATRDTTVDTQQVVPGTPERGRQLFTDKQCASCHAVGGKGPRIGPDLGDPGHHISLTQFAGLMWNHTPAMVARMKERGTEVPQLSGQEMADILAYLFTSHYFDATGSAQRGSQLVQGKGCLTCHSVSGKGGKVAADFATSGVVRSPASLVAGMWNHSRLMEAQAQKQQVAWPVLTGRELSDISAYLTSLGKPAPAKPRRKAPAK